MELRQLHYFVAVAEEASSTRAAARLHLAQPGISAQIRQLERELGSPLLDRAGRSVTPTEVGRAVLPLARAALDAVDRVRSTVDEFAGLLRGRVRVGLVSGAATDDLDAAAILADFHHTYPQVEISLSEDTSELMLAAVQRGDLDIALVGLTGVPIPPSVRLATVVDTALMAAVAATDPLAEQAEVRLPQLRERPVISLPTGTGVRGVFDRACAQADVLPRITFEAAAPALLARLAAHGLGVAVLPGLAPDLADRLGVRLLPIVPEVRAQLALAWRDEASTRPAVSQLLARLRDAFTTTR